MGQVPAHHGRNGTVLYPHQTCLLIEPGKLPLLHPAARPGGLEPPFTRSVVEGLSKIRLRAPVLQADCTANDSAGKLHIAQDPAFPAVAADDERLRVPYDVASACERKRAAAHGAQGSIWLHEASLRGLEPLLQAPEACVLPLDDREKGQVSVLAPTRGEAGPASLPPVLRGYQPRRALRGWRSPRLWTE